MRTLNRNKRKMWYSQPTSDTEIVRIYTDSDGKVVEIPTGEKVKTFGEPVEFRASINNKLSEVDVASYGIDNSANYSQIVVSKGYLPLNVGDVIWFKSEVKYKEINDISVVDEKSADYIVKGIADEGLSVDLYLLQRNI